MEWQQPPMKRLPDVPMKRNRYRSQKQQRSARRDPRNILTRFCEACGRFVSPLAMKQNRESIIGDERLPMIELISVLRETVRVAAFTNTIEMHWEVLQNRDRFSFPTIVEQTIASHVIGVAKPTRAAYH